MTGRVTLTHYRTGTPCEGGYCAECMLGWFLHGDSAWIVTRDDAQDPAPA